MLCFIRINGACVSYQVIVPLQRMHVFTKACMSMEGCTPVHFCVVHTARRSMWNYSLFRLHLRGIAFYFIYPFFFFFFTLTLQPGEANRFVLQQQEALNAKYIGRQEREVERGGGGADVKKEKRCSSVTKITARYCLNGGKIQTHMDRPIQKIGLLRS